MALSALDVGRVLAVSSLMLAAGGLTGCQKPLTATDGVVRFDVPAEVDGKPGPAAIRQPVELAPKDALIVRLGQHGGTGYVWQLAGPAPAVLTVEGQPTIEAANSLAGGEQWTTFTFGAVAQGDGTVRFVLRRPWEAGNEESRCVDMPVKVVPKKQ